MKLRLLAFFLLLSLLAACSAPVGLPTQTPDQTQAPPTTPTPGKTGEVVSTPVMPVSEVPAEILALAYADLGGRLGIKADQISLLSGMQVDFPNSCLGISTPGINCLDVITPGYIITLQAGSTVYTYHTDLKGAQVILATQSGTSGKPPVNTPQALLPVFNWSRSGGIAGFCDKLKIYPDGLVISTSCKQDERRFKLTTQQLAQLTGWLDAYGAVDYAHDDGPNVADGMSVTLKLSGRGAKTPTEAELSEMLAFASSISLQK